MSNKIGAMITCPKHLKRLPTVLESISNQVDTLYLYLNKFKSLPPVLNQFKNVYPILDHSYPSDLGDKGKMIFLKFITSESYCFTFEDDLIYPPNYTFTMIETLKRFNNKVVLGLEGAIIPDHANFYFEENQAFRIGDSLEQHTAINLIRSSSIAYQNQCVRLTFDSVLKNKFIDLTLSLYCHSEKVPLLAIKRTTDWVKRLSTSIPSLENSKPPYFDQLITARDQFKLNNIKQIWYSFLLENAAKGWYDYALSHKLDLELCSFVMGGVTPLNWRFTYHSMKNLLNSYDVLYPSTNKNI